MIFQIATSTAEHKSKERYPEARTAGYAGMRTARNGRGMRGRRRPRGKGGARWGAPPWKSGAFSAAL